MSALVALAGGLSTYAKLGSNLRPANSKRDGLVDERLEFSLGLVPSVSGQLDPLQNLSDRFARKLLRAARSVGYRIAPRSRAQLPASRARSAPVPCLKHAAMTTLGRTCAWRNSPRLVMRSIGPRWRLDRELAG